MTFLTTLELTGLMHEWETLPDLIPKSSMVPFLREFLRCRDVLIIRKANSGLYHSPELKDRTTIGVAEGQAMPTQDRDVGPNWVGRPRDEDESLLRSLASHYDVGFDIDSDGHWHKRVEPPIRYEPDDEDWYIDEYLETLPRLFNILSEGRIFI